MVTQIEFGVKTEPCQTKPVLVLLASKFVHHITGRVQVRQMGMSPTATSPHGQKYWK